MENTLVWIKKENKFTLVNKSLIQNDLYELYDENDNDKIDNLINISFINIPSIINILEQRYKKDLIYCYNGEILISVNPFKKLENIYDETNFVELNQPHIYSIAEKCFKNMCYKNQSIIVSGESGSGKTENTKYILRYLCNKYSSDSDLSKRIINSNHILEMFGNCKTVKNNNSSRFGKYINIFINNNIVIGSNIDSYLLEKSRVTNFNDKEKSYHIFYTINNNYLKKYNFKKNYRLILETHSQIIEEFQKTDTLIELFKKFKYTDEELDIIFYKIKVILELMNIVDSDSIFEIISKIRFDLEHINTSAKTLYDLFTNKKIKVNNEIISSKLNFTQSRIVIKSFCEDLYNDMFLDIIKDINHNLETDFCSSKISILDIFGFEVFEHNGFEQLCINYTNEILQNIYNDIILKNEQNIYFEEGIEWQYVDFKNNIEILNLFSSSTNSIFSIINEHCILNSDDDKIYNSIIKNCNNTNYLKVSSLDKFDKKFTISHYACDVSYTVLDFVYKNNIKSKSRLIKTNLHLFKKQLNELSDELMSNECKFVRCIKPNNNLYPENFNQEIIYHQLLNSGIIEGIKILTQGFPVKLDINTLETRLPFLKNKKKNINLILHDFFNNDEFKIGTKKIFLKNTAYNFLVNENLKFVIYKSIIINTSLRKYLYQKKYRSTLNKIIKIQSQARIFLSKNIYTNKKNNKACRLIIDNFKKYTYKKQFKNIIFKVIKIQNKYRRYRSINIIKDKRTKKKALSIVKKNLMIYIFKRRYSKLQNINKLNSKLNNVSKNIENYKQTIINKDEEIKRLNLIINQKNKDVINNIDNQYMYGKFDPKLNTIINNEALDDINKKFADMYIDLRNKELLLEQKNKLINSYTNKGNFKSKLGAWDYIKNIINYF